MTLSTLMTIMKETFEEVEGVESVYDDDAALMWNTTEVKYASIAFALQNTREVDGEVRHTFRIYAGDKLRDDHSNRNALYSELYNMIRSGLNSLLYTDGISRIEDNRTYEYSPIKMDDVLAVCTLTVTIVVMNDDDC